MLLACRGRQHSAAHSAVSGQDPAEAGVFVSQHVSVGWQGDLPVCLLTAQPSVRSRPSFFLRRTWSKGVKSDINGR